MPPARGHAAADALSNAGWNVTEAGCPMARTQRIKMMADVKDWLAT